MTDELQVHVGGFDTIAKHVADAWRRAKGGEDVSAHHVTFVSWQALAAVLTDNRLKLLRALHRAPSADIDSLADTLGLEPVDVRADVDVLAGAGLLEMDTVGLRVDYDEIRTVVEL